MTDIAMTGDGLCQCDRCLARARKWHVRAWHALSSVDLTKPPAPLLRWAGIILTGFAYAAAGAPTRLGDWLWAAIIGGALLLPDVAGFAVAGVRVDLKKTQDELTALKVRLDMRQEVTTYNYYGALERATEAQAGETSPKNVRVVSP
jgi:hypothetical protein